MTNPPQDAEGDDSVFLNNISPIRVEMQCVFDANTPILDPGVQERIDYRRYDSGICKDCDEKRGEFTPWCYVHYPWGRDQWVEKGRGWTRDDLEGME